MTPSLTTRVTVCLAWLREQRAAGTSGRWHREPERIGVYLVSAPLYPGLAQCKSWRDESLAPANIACITTSVNLSEEMCRLVEGMLNLRQETLNQSLQTLIDLMLAPWATAVEVEMEAQGK